MSNFEDNLSGLVYPNAIPLTFEKFYTQEYVPHRRLKMILLSDILGTYAQFKSLTYDQKAEIIKKIEESCYQQACKHISELDQECNWENSMFYCVYNYICGNLFQNLDPQSEVGSDYLITKVWAGTVELDKLAQLTSEELCPEKSLEIRTNIAQRSDIKFSIKTSTAYQCSKCKKSECTIDRRHTRGLDEATNYRATCLFCKHTWNI